MSIRADNIWRNPDGLTIITTLACLDSPHGSRRYAFAGTPQRLMLGQVCGHRPEQRVAVHLATVLHRPPSMAIAQADARPVMTISIIQIGLRLANAQADVGT